MGQVFMVSKNQRPSKSGPVWNCLDMFRTFGAQPFICVGLILTWTHPNLFTPITSLAKCGTSFAENNTAAENGQISRARPPFFYVHTAI